MRILLIEDEEAFIVLISAILALYGVSDLIIARSVEDAIPLIPESDLVITDYNYPGGGFEAIREYLVSQRKPYILQSSALTPSTTSECMLGFVCKSNLVKQLPERLAFIKAAN